jgi:hypothetical protein
MFLRANSRQGLRFTISRWMRWVALVALCLGLLRDAQASGRIRTGSAYFENLVILGLLIVLLPLVNRLRRMR